jgi:hypothetical protein
MLNVSQYYRYSTDNEDRVPVPMKRTSILCSLHTPHSSMLPLLFLWNKNCFLFAFANKSFKIRLLASPCLSVRPYVITREPHQRFPAFRTPSWGILVWGIPRQAPETPPTLSLLTPQNSDATDALTKVSDQILANFYAMRTFPTFFFLLSLHLHSPICTKMKFRNNFRLRNHTQTSFDPLKSSDNYIFQLF